MPMYGHGLYYNSETESWKDASTAPDTGSYPVFEGFGEQTDPQHPGHSRTGLIVGLATTLTSVALFVLTLRLRPGRTEGR